MNPLTRSLLTGSIIWVTLSLVATAAFGQGITIDLGKTETGRYLNMVGNTPGSDGEITSNVYIPPEYCVTSKGGAMYFAVNDSFFYQLPTGTHVIVNVEYYDAPGTQIKLVYDATGNHSGKEHSESITTTGTNTWKAKSFTIDDAYFGDGLANGADLKLVAASGTMTVNAISVIPFSAYMDYGTVCDSANMTRKEWMSLDSKDTIVVAEGEECVSTTATDNYLYIDVAEAFIAAGNHPYVFVSVEYYDADPTYQMRLQYDALEAGPGETKNRYKSTAYVYGEGWNSFRTYTFEISDAYFNNRENGGTDFRLQIRKPGLAVNRITLGVLHTKPWPNTATIPGFTAYKALEPPVVDGSLVEWSWTGPYTVQPTFATGGSRTDEFYRTWLLNPENVPVAEPGEAGVTDPGVPGLWDTNDLGGNVNLLWGDTYLYVAANVKDNVVDVDGTNWNEKDGFGLYLDVSHDYNTAGTAPIARKDDQSFTQGEHFFFFPASSGELGTWKHSSSQNGEAMSNAILKSYVKTDSGYVIEAAIPLDLIRDGFTWNPGILGDKDNYSPLFGWMINDADGVGASSGRLMFGANSDDDEFWSTLKLGPLQLVDQGITVDFGTPNYESFMVQTEKGGDGAVQIVGLNGKNCAKLANGYVYLDVDNNAIFGGNHRHLFVSVEYYDSTGGSTNFRMQYDAESAPYKDTYTVNIGNTKKWKTEIFELTDANFAGSQNGSADFRIHCPTNDLLVDQVRVGIADLWIDLGDSAHQTAYGIKETNLGGDGMRTPVFIGGQWCQRNGMGYPENSRYFYYGAADSIIYHGNHKELFLTAEYYDTTSSGGVGLMYDALGTQWATSPTEVFVLGTNQWKLHTFSLSDAYFTNRESGGADFRLAGWGTGPTFINRVLIGIQDPVTSVDLANNKPSTFRLEQNYPNPFNPVTTIRYTVGGNGAWGVGDGDRAGTRGSGPALSGVEGLGTRKTRLVVYDLLGRQVATLVDEAKAPGSYEVRFDASGLASGMYIYRLTAGASVQSRKMMLLK